MELLELLMNKKDAFRAGFESGAKLVMDCFNKELGVRDYKYKPWDAKDEAIMLQAYYKWVVDNE
jgi:hypothetical protein